MMTKPPCFDTLTRTDCPQRRVGCRENCKAWKDWLVVHEQELADIRRKRKIIDEANEFMILQGERTRRSNQARYERNNRRNKQ